MSRIYVTVVNTVWLYPESDVLTALSNTSHKYTFDGVQIICPDITELIGVYEDIFNQTVISQPVGNQGFSLGVGTNLEDIGKIIEFKLASGETVIRWALVKQLTPQEPYNYIPVPGNSPPNTIGYVPIFVSYSSVNPPNFYLDPASVVRV